MWRPKFQQSDVRVFYIENADEKRHTILQCLNHHFRTNFRSTLKVLPLQEQQCPLNIWLPFWYTSFRPYFILFLVGVAGIREFCRYECTLSTLFSLRLLLPLRRWRDET